MGKKIKKHTTLLIPTLFWLFFFILFIYLGIWQLHRYHYKINLINTYHAAIAAKPIALAQVTLNPPPAFLQVTTEGFFLNDKTMLLDHQDNDGHNGYEV